MKGKVMNPTSIHPSAKVSIPVNRLVQDDEKRRIMEKIYHSEVFSQFVQQWGNAMSTAK